MVLTELLPSAEVSVLMHLRTCVILMDQLLLLEP